MRSLPENLWTPESKKFINSPNPHIYAVKIEEGTTVLVNGALLLKYLGSDMSNSYIPFIEKVDEDVYRICFYKK